MKAPFKRSAPARTGATRESSQTFQQCSRRGRAESSRNRATTWTAAFIDKHALAIDRFFFFFKKRARNGAEDFANAKTPRNDMVEGHEATLLSRFLNDETAIDKYPDLKSEHFGSPVNRQIFGAILTLHFDGHKTIFPVVEDYLRGRGKLKEIGEHTLSTLAADSRITAMDDSCFDYAHHCVMDAWREREEQRIGKDLASGKITAAKASSELDKIKKPIGQGEEAAIRGAIISILTDGKLSVAEQRSAIADAVVRSLLERGQFFFHAERRDFDSAMFFDQKRKRLERIKSDAFQAWLSDWLRVNRADVLFRYISAEVETVALSGKHSKSIVPETFWASRPSAIYLSNGDGAMARITASGVEIVDNGADGVLFAAGNTVAPWTQTDPQDPFEVCSVFSNASYAAPHGWDLLRTWIISLPTNPASKPPLCAVGPVGSGKTKLASAIAEFYGIPIRTNKVEDFGEDSFWASLDEGGVFTLDNCDTRNKWLADAVAAAATAGCSQRRKKYTDSETVTLHAHAAIILTTANPSFASDAGLADRTLVLRMNRRTDETSDAKLSLELAEHRNAGLSFIAQTLANALADKEHVPAGLNLRHPDFASFGVRIGRAIDREVETVTALRMAETDKATFCLENDFIGAALIALLDREQSFTGTASQLRERLIDTDTDIADKPPSTKRLSRRLAALWSHLEKAFVAKQEKDRNHFIIYTLKSKSAEFAEFQTVF